MSKYKVNFSDIVTYEFEVEADDEHDALYKVSRMPLEEYVENEIDRDDYTKITIVK